MMEAEWLLDDNTCAPLYAVDRFLIPATDVGWVEMMKTPEEMNASEEQVKEVLNKLVSLQTTGDDDGDQIPATAPAPGQGGVTAVQPGRERNERKAKRGRGRASNVASSTSTKNGEVKKRET